MKKITPENRLITTSTTAVVILGFIYGLFIYGYIRSSFLEWHDKYIKDIFVAKMSHLQDKLEMTSLLAKNLAKSPQVVASFESKKREPLVGLNQFLLQQKYENEEIIDIYVVDNAGKIVESTDKMTAGQNYIEKSLQKIALGGEPPLFVDVSAHSTGKEEYFFSEQTKKQDGSTTGAVVIKVSRETLRKLIVDIAGEGSNTVMLVDSRGIVLYSNLEANIYSSLRPLDEKKTYETETMKEFENVAIKSLDIPHQTLLSDKESQLESFVYFDNKSKIEKNIIIKSIAPWPYFIVLENNRGGAYKFIGNTSYAIVASTLLVSTIVIFLALKFIVNKTSSLLSCVNFAKQISDNNFSQTLKINSSDEIGDLANVLNTLAKKQETDLKILNEKVLDQTKHLQEKVEDQTKTRKAMLNLLEDVTEEKQRAEGRLIEMQKFRMAVENASDHIVITDPDGIVLFANKAAEQMTGFSNEEILGSKAGVKWGKLMENEVYEEMWAAIKVKKIVFEGELNNRRKDGTMYIAEAKIAPILDQNGDVNFFVGIERDITKAKEVDRMKTEFISLASHQLRTPLTGIKWLLEMVLHGDYGDLSPQLSKTMIDVEDSNNRMIKLVDSLLNVSRIESGRISISPEPIDISKLMQQVIKDLQPIVIDKGVSIILNTANNIPTLLSYDPKLVREVFTNLIANSLKYSFRGGKILIDIRVNENDLLLSFADQGCGIPANEGHRVFEKFFRASNAVKKEVDGNGLGLYLVKSIVESSQGTIRFESSEGKGTTFFVTLPLSGSIAKEGVVTITASRQ